MPPLSSLTLSAGTVRGLAFIQKYRFLTIGQFARCANFSTYHAAEVLRTLERRNGVGYFGFVSIPAHGKTPKAYFQGWELLQQEIDDPEISGSFMEVHQEATWTPQMYHRLRLLDLFVSLEIGVQRRPHLHLVQTFIEYRRIKGTHVRETTDFVTDKELPEDRIVPDGAFILENLETGRRGLFLVEMDMGSERIEAPESTDQRATALSESHSSGLHRPVSENLCYNHQCMPFIKETIQTLKRLKELAPTSANPRCPIGRGNRPP